MPDPARGEDAITLRRFEPGNVLVAAHWLKLPQRPTSTRHNRESRRVAHEPQKFLHPAAILIKKICQSLLLNEPLELEPFLFRASAQGLPPARRQRLRGRQSDFCFG